MKFDMRLPLWISILILIIAGATVVKGLDTYTKYLRGTMTVYYADDIEITAFHYDSLNNTAMVSLEYHNGGTAPNCTIWIIQDEKTLTFEKVYSWNWTTIEPYNVTTYLDFNLTKGVLIIEVTSP